LVCVAVAVGDARRAAHLSFPADVVVRSPEQLRERLTDNDAGPFGGMKFSGSARDLGEEGLEEFLGTKHMHWDFSQEKKSWWYPYAAHTNSD
jgi:hypothetical protein